MNSRGSWIMRGARMTLGVAFLALGVVGLFLPFLQGVLFLVIGLTLLSTESERARRWLDWLRSRVSSRPKGLRSEHNGK